MLLKIMKIFRPFVEWNHPARVLTDGLVTEHNGPLDIVKALVGESKEHVEGGEGGSLVGSIGVETVVTIIGDRTDQPESRDRLD